MNITKINGRYFKNWFSKNGYNNQEISEEEYNSWKMKMYEVPASVYNQELTEEMFSDKRNHIKKGVIKYLTNLGCECRYSGKTKTLYLYNTPLLTEEATWVLNGASFNYQINS